MIGRIILQDVLGSFRHPIEVRNIIALETQLAKLLKDPTLSRLKEMSEIFCCVKGDSTLRQSNVKLENDLNFKSTL